jgi:hypothetical protein
MNVQDVMRLLGIKGLPAKRETGQVKIILSHIGRELRDFRYSYLAKVCTFGNCATGI